jgi:hypothetical protein
MRDMKGCLLAAVMTLVLTNTVHAAEGPSVDDSAATLASPALSRDAQHALICETVTDWAAYQVTQLIRNDAKESQAISSEGLQILRQIRLTEGLASAAFDALAPQADHNSMYRDAVKKMQAYLHEDHDGADATTQQMVPVCQQTYARMAASGKLSEEQVRLAEGTSQESIARLTEELQAPAAQR